MTSYLTTNLRSWASFSSNSCWYAFTRPAELWKLKVFVDNLWFCRINSTARTQRRSATACWLHIRGGRLITSLREAPPKSIIIIYMPPGMWPARAMAWGANITPKIRSVIKHPPRVTRVTARACMLLRKHPGASPKIILYYWLRGKYVH